MKLLVIVVAVSSVVCAVKPKEKRGVLGLGYGLDGGLSHGLGDYSYDFGLHSAPVYSAPLAAPILKSYSAPVVSAPILKSYSAPILSAPIFKSYPAPVVSAPLLKSYSAPLISATPVFKSYAAPVLSAPLIKSYTAPVVSAPLSFAYGHGLGLSDLSGGHGLSYGSLGGFGYGKYLH